MIDIPILFQTGMVCALLEDRKDVTRRIRGKELDLINQAPDEWRWSGTQSLTVKGTNPVETPGLPVTWKNYLGPTSYSSATTSFLSLWDSINAKPKKGKPAYAWELNPWVLRVEFKVLSKNGKPEVQ